LDHVQLSLAGRDSGASGGYAARLQAEGADSRAGRDHQHPARILLVNLLVNATAQ
jgi:hypothetical protein